MITEKAKIVIEYITDDGEIFYDEMEAKHHEEYLIKNKINERAIKIEPYKIYKINNKGEFEIFKNINTGSASVLYFSEDDIKSFPVYITEETCDYYFYEYRLLTDVVDYHKVILEKISKLI